MQPDHKENKKSPLGTDNFEREKPSALKSAVLSLAVIAVLILIGYLFGK